MGSGQGLYELCIWVSSTSLVFVTELVAYNILIN